MEPKIHSCIILIGCVFCFSQINWTSGYCCPNVGLEIQSVHSPTGKDLGTCFWATVVLVRGGREHRYIIHIIDTWWNVFTTYHLVPKAGSSASECCSKPTKPGHHYCTRNPAQRNQTFSNTCLKVVQLHLHGPKSLENLEVLVFGLIMSKNKLDMNMSDWSKTKLRGGFIPLPNNKIWSLLKLASKEVQKVFEGVDIFTWIYRLPYLSKIDLEQLSNRWFCSGASELLSMHKKHGCRHCDAEKKQIRYNLRRTSHQKSM